MDEKNIKVRIIHKHDIEENWIKAVNFIPKQAEIIVYDIDENHTYERFKIGDGVTNVNDLDFANNDLLLSGTGEGSAMFPGATEASGENSTAEGYLTKAIGNYSHAEGRSAKAFGESSHAEGINTIAFGAYSQAGNIGNKISDKSFGFNYNGISYSLTLDNLKPIIKEYLEEDNSLRVSFEGKILDGLISIGTLLKIPSIRDAITEALEYSDNGALIELENKILLPLQSVNAENIANNILFLRLYTSVENIDNILNQKIIDIYTGIAYGEGSHTEGYNNISLGDYSHSEGKCTTTIGQGSHAEGDKTKTEGDYSHAEGIETEANGKASHAEGDNTTAYEFASHAEGSYTYASAYASHTEGFLTEANDKVSHVEGYGNISTGQSSHVQGKWNKYQDETGNLLNYAHVVGNGSSDSNRSNAHTLDWKGNAWFAGTVKAGRNTTDDDDDDLIVVTKGYLKSYVELAINIALENIHIDGGNY